MTANGQLQGVPRDPELVLTLECTLLQALDLTVADLYSDLGTSREEGCRACYCRIVAC
jgi:hypothetical protein